MRKILNLPFYTRVLCICVTLINITSAKAFDPKHPPFNDIYVVINYTNARLSLIFDQIEKQTSFSFVYDENDINLSKEIKLSKGQQRLKDVLGSISKQAGLQFTEKQNIILVNPGVGTVRNVVFSITAAPITGVVRDAGGTPLPGVTVSVKGSRAAVQTDSQGKFSIEAPDNSILVFSIVDFKTQEVPVNGQASFNIKMLLANKELNEVVVVGYQTRRRGDLSGAVSVVNVGGISKLPVCKCRPGIAGKGIRSSDYSIHRSAG